MKKYLLAILLVGSLRGAYITNQCGGGRLGDQLLHYVRSKYIAYRYGISFYLTPFAHAEQFNLFDNEQLLPTNSNVVKINTENEIDPGRNVIYEILYMFQYSKLDHSHLIYGWKCLRNDLQFMQEVRYCLSPKNKTKFDMEMPDDCITVAMHIRRLSGWDRMSSLYSKQLYDIKELDITQAVSTDVFYRTFKRQGEIPFDIPFWYKFPPLQYYVDQLKKVIELESKQPLFVYIFTDDKDPICIRMIFEEKFKNNNIIFKSPDQDYGEEHVIRDIHMMSKFDYLIRSESSFAQVAHLVGTKFKKVFYPRAASWCDGCMVITQVGEENG